MGRAVIQLIDADGDRPQMSIPGADAADDGSDYAALNTAFDGIVQSIQDICLGNLWATQQVSDDIEQRSAPPANNFAQANTRWALEFSVDGLTGGPYTITAPTADLSFGVVRNGRIELDLGTAPGSLLKTNFEAWYFNAEAAAAGGTGLATLQVVYHVE